MKLEKVLTYQKGRSPQKDFVSDNLILYLTPEFLRGNGSPNFISDFPSKVHVEDGDLLLLWDGSNAGEFFKGRKGFLSSTMVKFKFDEEEYQREFLFYQLKAFEGYLKAQTNGSGIPHVDRELLLGIEVEKFEKTEQTRIAQILSKADAAIAQTDALIAKYLRIKTGLMQDLLTRGIDEQGNIRSKHIHRFVVKNGIEVPEEWEVDEFKTYCEKVSVGIATSSSDYFALDGVLFLRNQNIKENYISLDDVVYITKTFAEMNKSKYLKPDDILTVRTGYPGMSAIVPPELLGAQTFTTLISRPIKGRANSQFMSYYLNSDFGKRQIKNLQGGGAQQNLNAGALSKLIITIPQINEQDRIVKFIRNWDNHIEQLVNKFKKLQSLKTGLIQDLLSGKVRVNVNQRLETIK